MDVDVSQKSPHYHPPPEKVPMASSRRFESILLALAIFLLGLNFTYKVIGLTRLYYTPTRNQVNGEYTPLSLHR